jgi:hypothetical protein
MLQGLPAENEGILEIVCFNSKPRFHFIADA